MPAIVCIGDPTAHGAPIITSGANTKLTFNGTPFVTVGAQGPAHVGGHTPIVLVNVIVDATQSKITFNNTPLAVIGCPCSCGDVVIANPTNTKIFI